MAELRKSAKGGVLSRVMHGGRIALSVPPVGGGDGGGGGCGGCGGGANSPVCDITYTVSACPAMVVRVIAPSLSHDQARSTHQQQTYVLPQLSTLTLQHLYVPCAFPRVLVLLPCGRSGARNSGQDLGRDHRRPGIVVSPAHARGESYFQGRSPACGITRQRRGGGLMNGCAVMRQTCGRAALRCAACGGRSGRG